jgi:hypothetical protein
MVDWLTEVMTASECSSEAFFIAIRLMDRYFKSKTEARIQVTDLHLIGITCMWIATKFEDVIPLFLTDIVNRVAHGRISRE